MDSYKKAQLKRIDDFENTAKKFEEFFDCKIAAFDPGYVFWFPDENIRLEIPRWFVEKFNKTIK